jgi:hypothetical protein
MKEWALLRLGTPDEGWYQQAGLSRPRMLICSRTATNARLVQ